MRARRFALPGALALATLAAFAPAARARIDLAVPADLAAAGWRAPAPVPAGDGAPGRGGALRPQAVPEIVGPGRVTTAGRLWMKTTNVGYMGNPFPALSSDPGAQWPGPSGIEYLFNWSVWVGARTPGAVVGGERYRVSAGIEWRPPSLDPVDRIHRSYEGEPGGLRDVDDDGDGRVDEEWVDGRDDDGDGRVDEDFEGLSQGMDTCVLRDDTPQATGFVSGELHSPLGLRLQQRTLAFENGAAANLVGVEYRVQNVSGAPLDSVYVGFLVDQDVGPADQAGYWTDDLPEPLAVQQNVDRPLPTDDPRYNARTDNDHPSGFCTRDRFPVRGFALLDDDGDGGRTTGASAFLLLDHTIDLRGVTAPRRLGFRAFRVLRPSAPFSQGGLPISDLERYQLLAAGGGTAAGAIVDPGPELHPDDYVSFASIGPFPRLAPGETVRVVVALLVAPVDYALPRFDATGNANAERLAGLRAAAVGAFDLYCGRHETPPRGVPAPPQPGWETPLLAPPGTTYSVSDCHTDSTTSGGKDITDRATTWMDFDCDACTGVRGKLPRRWVVGSAPPAPAVRLTPADRAIVVEWDNRSEAVADRLTDLRDSTAYKAGSFNIWGYQLWRAGGYRRPVGSIGPADELWEMVAEYTLHDAMRPLVDSTDTDGDGRFDAVARSAPLLLDREHGTRVYPQDIPPLRDPLTGDTLFVVAARSGVDPIRGLTTDRNYRVPVYPVGRWRVTDRGPLNGFVYYYTVVAVDSLGYPGIGGTVGTVRRREGRPSALEAAGVVPQAAVAPAAGRVHVVPNPYRGRAAWDLVPDAADPTGSHVDFYGLPAGPWTIRIFTLAGDLVQTLRSDDGLTGGRRQQDGPDDGQASWNLLTRNGQDVASGIYLFSVESSGPTQRGKFVLIR